MAETATYKPNGNLAGTTHGIVNPEDSAEGAARTVQPEDVGSAATNRISFEATAEPISVTTDDDGNAIDPNTIPISDQKVRRRRSDTGTIRGPRKVRGSLAQASNLEKVMLSMHLMAATFLHVPELRIDEQESAMLTKATLDVLKAYGVPDLTEKQVAVANAFMAIGTVYGPRAVLIMNRKKNNRPKLVPFPATQAVQAAQPVPGPYTKPDTTKQAENNIVGAQSAQPAIDTTKTYSINPEAGFISSRDFGAEPHGLETV